MLTMFAVCQVCHRIEREPKKTGTLKVSGNGGIP